MRSHWIFLCAFITATLIGCADGTPTDTTDTTDETDDTSQTVTVSPPVISPYGLVTDGTSLFISNTGNNKISKMTIATPSTLADCAPIDFLYPGGMTTDGTNVFVADWGKHVIRRLNAP